MSLVNRRKNIEREERQVAREQREDAAGKLIQRVPDLTSLSLSIQEARPDGVASNTQYIRRVVVAQAPALFELPCSYSYCTDGGYDLTREILDALSTRATCFEGERACRGICGSECCARVLQYAAAATYR